MSRHLPYAFVLDWLHPLPVEVRLMFGLHGVYLDSRILLVLYRKEKHPKRNGIWIATQTQQEASLREALPAITEFSVLKKAGGRAAWAVVPETAVDFEASVGRVCKMIKANDPRIGRIP